MSSELKSLGTHWGTIRAVLKIMEKKVETTVVYWGL